MSSEPGELSAEDELFRSRIRPWRKQLMGAALITLTVAWAFGRGAPSHPLWLWVAVLWSLFAAQAWLCLRLDRIPATEALPVSWWRMTHALTVCVGIAWGSLAWWLPGDAAELPLLAGFASVMVALGAASSSDSKGLLLGIVIPAFVLIPSAMIWHAHILASVVVLLMLLLIFQHGMSLQRIMLDAIQLRRRADALTATLRIEQAKAQDVAREQAVLRERQRLTYDMHDGLGSTLMSTLVAVERGNLSQREVVAVLRDCIEDLRLVIDSLEPLGHDLELLLATLRHRLGQRLQAAGLTLDWHVEDLPKLLWMESPQALQVMRILQEVLTNTVRHAHATRVRIAAHHEPAGDQILITLADNGDGFNQKNAATGRGHKHLHSRSQSLGIDLRIHSVQGEGTQVTLRLPIRKAPSVEPYVAHASPIA